MEFVPTALPNAFISSEREESSPLELGKLTVKQILGSLTAAQAWKVGAAIIAILASVFLAGYKLGQFQADHTGTSKSAAQQSAPGDAQPATRPGRP